MPKLVVTHPVVNIERWLKGKAEAVESLAPYATNVTYHVAVDGSNNVALTADIHDMEGLQALMVSPPPWAVALDESYGVLPPTTAYIEK